MTKEEMAKNGAPIFFQIETLTQLEHIKETVDTLMDVIRSNQQVVEDIHRQVHRLEDEYVTRLDKLDTDLGSF